MSLNKRINLLTLTLQFAFTELVGFGFVYLLWCTAFIQFSYVVFNDCYFGLSTIAKSFMTMFMMILGKFPVDELVSTNPIMGSLVYVSFSVSCVMILMQLFITIINDAYEKVKHDESLIPSDAIVFDYFVKKCKKWLGLHKEDLGASSFGADKYVTGVTYFPTSVDKLVDSFAKVFAFCLF
jgi:hypothetical protein